MAVSLTFGLPGAGKTTIMVADILKARKSGRYDNIYCNVHVQIPGVTYIDNQCVGQYELCDCAVFIDEATLFADNRDFKNFSKGRISYFLEHRHRRSDIFLYTQQWNGVDLKIRVITDRVYYIYKTRILGHWISKCYRIPYGIIIPDPKKGADKLGEIVQGYCKPPLLTRLFCRRIWRPKFYKYFDSWEYDPLPALPDQYQPYNGPEPRTDTKGLFCCVKDVGQYSWQLMSSAGRKIRDLWRKFKAGIRSKGRFSR